jgi:hypothetical protein
VQCALDRARAAFGEINLGRERLDAHREILCLDTGSGDLGDEALQDVIVERVPLGLPPVARRLACRCRFVETRLNVERVNQRNRVEEQLEQRIEQATNQPQRPAVGFIESGVLEGIGVTVLGSRMASSRRAASS